MLVRFIACRHLVMVTGRPVILKLRKKLVHAIAERVLSEMSVILQIGEIFLTNVWYHMVNNKNIILMKGRGIIMDLNCNSMFRCNELMKYILLQLSYEEFSQVTDCFQNRLLTRDALTKSRKATICCVISACLSIRLHGSPGLPLAGFSCNTIFEYSSRRFRENSSSIDMWQE